MKKILFIALFLGTVAFSAPNTETILNQIIEKQNTCNLNRIVSAIHKAQNKRYRVNSVIRSGTYYALIITDRITKSKTIIFLRRC